MNKVRERSGDRFPPDYALNDMHPVITFTVIVNLPNVCAPYLTSTKDSFDPCKGSVVRNLVGDRSVDL